MKRLLLSFFLTTLIFGQTCAQTLRGQVQWHYGKQVIKGVEISAFGTSPAISNNFGQFEMKFQGKTAGDKVSLAVKGSFKRQALEVVDTENLKCILPKDPDELRMIYMCYAGQNPLMIEKNYEKSVEENFQKDIKIIEQKNQLSLQEKNAEIKKLTAERDIALKLAKEISERIGQLDISQADTLQKQAFQAFLKGNFKEVNRMLSFEKMEQFEIQSDRKLEALLRERQQYAQSYLIKAKSYVGEFNLDSAGLSYDKAISLDSTNFGILSEAADFYYQNRFFAKALRLYPKVIAHPEAQVWEVANAYSYMGNIYTITGNLDKVMENQQTFSEKYDLLVKQFPTNTFYLNNLAISYSKLGEVYTAKGDLNKALEYFEKDLKVTEQLYRLEPNNVSFANGLAISYEKLGSVYTAKGDLNKALEYFEKRNKLGEQLYRLEPNNVDFANGLAISYSKLGSVYTAKGDLNKALEYFEKQTVIFEQLYRLETNNVDFANGLAISYEKLGNVYTAKGDLNKALDYYEKYNELMEKLYALEPNNVDFANGLAISYSKLGSVYTAKGDLNKALEYYEKYNELKKKLYALEPNNVDFANGLALSYLYLGQAQEKLKDTLKAKSYYLEGQKLYRGLVRNFPQNGFQQNLQWVDTKLKAIYTAQKDWKALFEMAENEIKGLQQQDKDKEKLANAFGSAAWRALFAKHYAEAEKYAFLGLETDKTQEWIHTNLALAYLYQGKFEQAKSIYLLLKDKPYNKATYKETFLQDLLDLEKENITHPDVAKIKELLK
jgi:Flp pilus assembly protein TadD